MGRTLRLARLTEPGFYRPLYERTNPRDSHLRGIQRRNTFLSGPLAPVTL
jgi:hypothetical protein